jgi:integrase
MPRARTGSIDEVPGGFRVRMTLPTGDRKPLGVYPTWDEAEGVRLAALEQLGEDGDVLTLRDWGEKWLKAREDARALRNPEDYRSLWNNHVVTHAIADMLMRAIRPGDLDELVASMRVKHLAANTIKVVLTVVRGALRAAFRKGLVKVDPFAAGVPVPKDARTTDPWTYATQEEQRAILDACRPHERHVVAFAIASGLRAGELIALRLGDVHEDRIVVRYGGAPDRPTKSGKVRTVFLNGLAKTALDAWIAELPKFTATKRFPDGRNPLGLVFPGQLGGFRCEEHVLRWKAWKRVLKTAGITREFRWHSLRHTCASALVSGWWGRRWSLEEVREVLGHADLRTTQRYAHLASDALATAAKETRIVKVETATILAMAKAAPHEPSQNTGRETQIEGGANFVVNNWIARGR